MLLISELLDVLFYLTWPVVFRDPSFDFIRQIEMVLKLIIALPLVLELPECQLD